MGTSSNQSKSLTCQLGFAALAPTSSASAGLVPPPLRHWTSNETQQSRIECLFKFSDAVNAGMSVVGAELVMLLLCDLYDRNDRIPIAALQNSICLGTLKGSMSIQGLSETLEGEASFVYPHTFSRAKDMVSQAGHDVKSCLMTGLRGHCLRYFPALKFYSVNNNKKVLWNFKDFWEIHDISEEPSVEARAVSLVGDVCLELERMGLCFIRNTEKYMQHGMPWVKEVLLRLPEALQGQDLVDVMCFVRCIGILQNGTRLSYSSSNEEYSVPERILSEPVAEEGAEDDFRSEEENVRKLIPRALPANCSIRWSSMELALGPDATESC
ncbi:hypothetical protein PO909_000239 [Leuciscus waleckii]